MLNYGADNWLFWEDIIASNCSKACDNNQRSKLWCTRPHKCISGQLIPRLPRSATKCVPACLQSFKASKKCQRLTRIFSSSPLVAVCCFSRRSLSWEQICRKQELTWDLFGSIRSSAPLGRRRSSSDCFKMLGEGVWALHIYGYFQVIVRLCWSRLINSTQTQWD